MECTSGRPFPLSTFLTSIYRRSQLLSASRPLCHLAKEQSAASRNPRYHSPPVLTSVGHNAAYCEHQVEYVSVDLSVALKPFEAI